MSYNIPRKAVRSGSYMYASIGEQTAPSRQESWPSATSPAVTARTQQEVPTSARGLGLYKELPDPTVEAVCEDQSGEKPPANTSHWKVDWQTPVMLVGLYAAALGAAVGHLIFFLKINGVHVNTYYIPQGYVTTISTLIATTWSLCLSACLSIVFTQSLWHLLRSQFTSVADIDKLYGLLGNVFLVRPRLILSMPVLYLIAFLVWSLSIVKTLPPGALTVETVPYINTTDIEVPIFNSSFVGSGSIMDIAPYMPGPTTFVVVEGDIRLLAGGDTLVNRFTKTVAYYFATGELRNPGSPCGANCSFAFEFEGPYLDCDTEISNTTVRTLNDLTPGQNNQLEYQFYTADYNWKALNVQIFKPISVPGVMANGSFTAEGDQTLAEVNNLTCRYATAMYTVNVTHADGFQNITYTTQPSEPLDYTDLCQDEYQIPKVGTIYGINCGGLGDSVGPDGNLLLSDMGRKAVKAVKTYTLIQYLLGAIKGSMPLTCTLPNQLTGGSNALSCKLGVVDEASAPIIRTFFYQSRQSDYGSNSNLPQLANEVPSLNISPAELNAALFNLTMVYATSDFSFFNTTVTATSNWLFLTFVFSHRLNLILPYFVPLGLAMPALMYAFLLLYYKHHVSAMGDSFIQILMTTTGTRTLTEMAAGGCLGGSNNVPEALNRMKIKYGDVTESMETETHRMDGVVEEDAVVRRRAGFGVEGEVQPLRRRAVYGSNS